jgi:phosphoribosylamine--glycine ligase
MMVSAGYPGSYEKGKILTGEALITDTLVFHSGTRINSETRQTETNGGRVLALTSLGNSLHDALSKSYENADKIDFEGKYFRRDIGFDLE